MSTSFSFAADIEPLLYKVTKPARYTGGEYNSIVKDGAELTFALCYPDVYEIGMSNLGLKILYESLNRVDWLAGERVYAPWPDFEEQLRASSLPLYTLESKRPVRDVDILGFTLQYELTYTNILKVLDLSGIPLFADKRTDADPFVVGGGPCVYNPAPLAPYFDLFFIGDGDEAVVAVAEAVRDGKRAGLSRKELLEKLNELPYLLVPSLDGSSRRQIEADLNQLPFPRKQLVPNTKIIQDRGLIETSRGCTNGCRFCHAGTTYRPVRERDVAELCDLAESIVDATGFTELSLASLSISDYTLLPELVEALNSRLEQRGVSFTLPSLRVDSFSLQTASLVGKLRKGGLTFAVESGDEAVRARLNKPVDEAYFMQVIESIWKSGWKLIKLYFMIGFPGIQDEEKSIVAFVDRIREKFPKLSINMNVGILIPKAHTPFQWEAQMAPDDGWEKICFLKDYFKKSRVKVSFHKPRMSFLEGVFARGSGDAAALLYRAYQKGAHFDGWDEYFNIALWQEAMEELGQNAEQYLDPFNGDVAAPLPWDNIFGVANKDFLLRELDKYKNSGYTPDCRQGCQESCSVCGRGIAPRMAAPLRENCGSSLGDEQVEPLRVGYRFRFNKKGLFKYVSHLDMQQHLVRALVRSGLPLSFTQGFNPKPRVRFAMPVMLGVESYNDVFEVELSAEVAEDELLRKLSQRAPEGMEILSVRKLALLKTGLSEKINMFRFEVDAEPELAYLASLGLAKEDWFDSNDAVLYRMKQSGVPRARDFLEGLYGCSFDTLLARGLRRTGLFRRSEEGAVVDVYNI